MQSSSVPPLAETEPDCVFVERNVMVPMRDGVHLATDIYFPTAAAAAWPVILQRTPYGKEQTNHADRTLARPTPISRPEVARRIARGGYISVLQDCRGRCGSEGRFRKYLDEAEDGADTVAWLCAQPWCNGRVGTMGLSYGAHVQLALASAAPPALGAMFLDSGGFSSAFHSGIRQGGAFELKQLTWALKHARLSSNGTEKPPPDSESDVGQVRKWARINPWRKGHSPLSWAPEFEDYIVELWANETFSEFWKRPSLYAVGRYECFAHVPSIHMCSWFDPYALTATQNYAALAALKKAPVKLVLGPWTHGQRSVTFAGDVDFGSNATLDGNVAPDYLSLNLAWFDRHLRGIDAPEHLPAPVKIFVMGGGSGKRTASGRLDHGGRWRDESDWPLRDSMPTPFFLHADGSLRKDPPRQAGKCDWRHDPLDPIPTIGGAVTSGLPLMEGGAFDQREPATSPGALGRPLAERADILVFQTGPLAEPVEVTGPIGARFWVSSSAVDTDVTIKLIDVYPPNSDYPAGYAMNLTHGILRLRFRDGFEKPKLMTPGRPYQIEIQAFPTSNLFAVGHRIRIEVASSNFPHFDVNPNNGAPAGVSSTPVVAENAIHLSPEMPSHVSLPIVRMAKSR